MKYLTEVLQLIRPGSSYTWIGSLSTVTANDINWLDTHSTKPTQQEIDDGLVAYEQILRDTEYQRLRQYPSIGDQLDMLWHAIDNGTLNKTSDFYTAIKAVKDAHPKE
jgi:hypothetical protein